MEKHMSKKQMMDFESECRRLKREELGCVQEQLDKTTFCACENYTVDYALYRLENREAEEMMCSTTYGCVNQEVQDCINIMYEAMYAVWDSVTHSDARERFEKAEECQSRVRKDNLSMEGCHYDLWLFEEDMKKHRLLYEAKFEGCDIDAVTYECPYPDIYSDPCNKGLREHINEHVECLGKGFNATEPCRKLLILKNDYTEELTDEARAQCKIISHLRQTMAKCEVSAVKRQYPAKKHESHVQAGKRHLLEDLLKKALKDLN